MQSIEQIDGTEEREKLMGDLREENAALRAMVEGARAILMKSIIGYWVVDTGGRILEANDAYCRMSGYSREELLTMKINDIDPDEDPRETMERIAQIMKEGSGASRCGTAGRTAPS